MRALTVALFFLSFSALAQNNSINVYPWNPDSDNDNQIGVDDLQSFLTVYGNEFGLPPEPCTYDGTNFEDVISGSLAGSLIIDSIFIEFELEHINSYYPLGCPEPISDTLIFNNSSMLYLSVFDIGTYLFWHGEDSYNNSLDFRLSYDGSIGEYGFWMFCHSIDALGFTDDGFFGNTFQAQTYYFLPFPTDWYIDADGIHMYNGWDDFEWPYYANYLHILPYWHYADE